MRRLILILGVITLAAVAGNAVRYKHFFQCGWGAVRNDFKVCVEKSEAMIVDLERFGWIPGVKEWTNLLPQVKPIIPFYDYFSGNDSSRLYIVLLQNEDEIRANGGFVGSYAKVRVEKAVITDVEFVDIYQPDGQIEGHIESPEPIQEAFRLGTYRLRDFDWSPDFTRSADVLRWFMEKGGEEDADVILTLGSETIREFLRLVGPLTLESGEVVSADNMQLWLQSEAEDGFFPGSDQKRYALSVIGKELVEKTLTAKGKHKAELVKVVLNELRSENIVMHSKESGVQGALESAGWSGSWHPTDCSFNGCVQDDFAIVETNLGANKANCCVKRRVQHRLIDRGDGFLHEVELTLTNDSPSGGRKDGGFYGGDYLVYLRFYLPINAEVIEVSSTSGKSPDWLDVFSGNDMQKVDKAEAYGFQELGFFQVAAAKGESLTKLIYKLPKNEDTTGYQLTIHKQHGLRESAHEVDWFGKEFTFLLNDDYRLVTN